MKSLKTPKILVDNPSIFTADILHYIQNEGFMLNKNDSYCYREMMKHNDKLKWCDDAYTNTITTNNIIHIYIFENGIGVDVDYDCGGNMNNTFWSFDNYSSFDDVYDLMVDYVNSYR